MMNSQKFMKGYRAGQSGRYIAHIPDISQLVSWRVSFIDGWRCEGRQKEQKRKTSDTPQIPSWREMFSVGSRYNYKEALVKT